MIKSALAVSSFLLLSGCGWFSQPLPVSHDKETITSTKTCVSSKPDRYLIKDGHTYACFK